MKVTLLTQTQCIKSFINFRFIHLKLEYEKYLLIFLFLANSCNAKTDLNNMQLGDDFISISCLKIPSLPHIWMNSETMPCSYSKLLFPQLFKVHEVKQQKVPVEMSEAVGTKINELY